MELNDLFNKNSLCRITSVLFLNKNLVFLPNKRIHKDQKIKTIIFHKKDKDFIFENCLLNQTHQNIIEIILSQSKYSELEDGRMSFCFSKYQILKCLGHTIKKNHKWLEDKLEDLRKTDIVIKSDVNSITQGIISEHKTIKLKSKISGKALYGIILSINFVQFLQSDLNLFYPELVPSILNLKHAVNQALVRYCLANNKINYSLVKLLSLIGVDKSKMSDRNFRNYIKSVLEEKDKLNNDFGIKIHEMKTKSGLGVFYSKHKKVYFFKNKHLDVI